VLTRVEFADMITADCKIRQLVDLLGGARTAAEGLGVSQALVYFCLSGERRFPIDKCPVAERLTNGAIRCEDLRPDVEWAVLRGGSAA
jgi:DNA-binding transcriptional regulator YdaS (Cro superfamily)